jgi:hypothetical protein
MKKHDASQGLAAAVEVPENRGQERDEGFSSDRLEDRRRAIGEQVRDYVRETFDELHAASRSETQVLLEGVKHIKLDEEDISGWENFCKENLQAMARSAHTLYHSQLMDPLLRAYNDHVISKRVIEELDRKFRDDGVDYKDKETYVLYVLPERLKEWRLVKAKRDRLAKDARIKELTSSRVPGLTVFLNPRAFAELKFPERKSLADRVEAALDAKEIGADGLYDEARDELKGYADQGIMHPSKVGVWLGRIFRNRRKPEEARQIIEKILRPNAERWAEVRAEFDRVDTELAKDVPRGFNRLSDDAFLMLDYRKRTTYCSLAWVRLENVEETNKQLASLKLRARHELDTEDWEGADETITNALQLSGDNRELLSMQAYLRAHRSDESEKKGEKPNPDPQKLVEELRTIVSLVPDAVQPMYIEALQKGPEVFYRLLQVFFNRVWCEENGHLNREKERKQSQSEWNKEQTRKYAEEGHSEKLEHNILDGDTAVDSAIRDDCSKPQLLYMSSMGQQSVMKKIEMNAGNESFGYWTTIIPPLSYNSHAFMVKNLHYPMKSRLRTLISTGHHFTMSGKVQKVA